MQAIQESNEHLAEAISLFSKKEDPDEQDRAFFEVYVAETKASQAVALALINLANVIKQSA